MSWSGIARIPRAVIQIRGLDASKFLNGLITTRLLPNVVKKKQHTISDNENRHLELQEVIDPQKNWGLMHEDIYDPDFNIFVRRDGVLSMFLNSKGRVVNDCFVYANPYHTLTEAFRQSIEEPNFLIEIDNKYTSSLQTLLRMHKLSARVKIEPLKEVYSYYYYNETPEFEEWLEELQGTYFTTGDPQGALENANKVVEEELIFNKASAPNVTGFAIDNRIPNFGLKVLTTKELQDPADIFSDSFKALFDVKEVLSHQIADRRYTNGLFETADAPKGMSLLPFECNLDYINGLSLEKGCYVGQELTIRTYNGGVIRKRVVPLSFSGDEGDLAKLSEADVTEVSLEAVATEKPKAPAPSPLDKPEESNSPFGKSNSPFGSSPKPRRQSKIGKLLSVRGKMGFALVNLDKLKKDNRLKVLVPGVSKDLDATAHVPEWWPEEI